MLAYGRPRVAPRRRATPVRGGDTSFGPAPERARIAMNPRRSVAIAAVIFRHQCLKWSAIICDPRRSPKRREAPHVQGLRESGARGLEHPDLLGAIQQARRAVPRQNRPISGALCRRGRRAVRANRRRCSAILADSGTHCGECLNGTFKRGPSCASRPDEVVWWPRSWGGSLTRETRVRSTSRGGRLTSAARCLGASRASPAAPRLRRRCQAPRC